MIHSRRRNRQRRGTALLEFVMCLPLLALILTLTYFLGWAMRNQQRVWTADRYFTWRTAAGGQSASLNEAFFSGQGQNVDPVMHDGPDGTLVEYVRTTEQYSPLAGVVIGDMIDRRFVPRGLTGEVRSEFPTSVSLWNRLAEGQIRSRHSREGASWRRSDTRNYGPVIQNRFLYEFDERVNDIPGSSIGQAMRMLYLHGW